MPRSSSLGVSAAQSLHYLFSFSTHHLLFPFLLQRGAEEISNATPPEARPLKSKTPRSVCSTGASLYSNAVKVLMREISPHVAAEELVAPSQASGTH